MMKASKTPILTLVPVGGLANRMKAIDAATHLTQRAGIRLRIVWFRDKGLNCRFDQLFQPLSLPNLTLREAERADYLLLDRPRRRNGWLPYFFQSFLFDDCIYEDKATQLFYQHFDFQSWANKGKKYLASCVYFQPSEEKRFSIFRPISALQEQIDKVSRIFDEQAWGVHIRRTDNVASIKESPTELFIERMQTKLQENPETLFYVASDSAMEKQMLKEQFSNHIITSVGPTDRNSVKGMQHALVELYVLSKTKGIWGSVKSSYSETAAQINNIPCELLKKSV